MSATLTLGELYDACDRGDVMILPPIVTTAHLDLLARLLGEAWKEQTLDIADFEARFPAKLKDDDVHFDLFGGQRGYGLFRDAINKLLVGQGQVSSDVWQTLKILGREGAPRRDTSDLVQPLWTAFGPSIHPAEITRDMAVKADAKLIAVDRMRFRKSLATLDILRELPKVRDAGLLGKTPIGRMPHVRVSGRRETPLPAAWSQRLQGWPAWRLSALKGFYEVAVEAGLLKEGQEIEPRDLITEPLWPALREVLPTYFKDSTISVYLSRLSTVLEPASEHEEIWQSA